jgi:Methylamine utilisation protein MauE
VAGIGSGASLFLAGCVASCGGLLVVAGASKLYRAARRMPGASAVRRALGMTKRRWRPVKAAAGVLECAAGTLVCAGVYPGLGGAAMAALGAGFCVLLGYARARRVPGGCGCIQWRTAPPPAAETVSRREIARAAVVAVAGAAGAVFLRGQAGAFDQPWFCAGILVGGGLLIVLSTRARPRTPVCRRPVWFPARATLRALAGHGVFEAMAESAGPFGPVVRYRRAGCGEEYWFTPLLAPSAGPGQADRGAGRAVVFQARYAAPGGGLAVQASVRDAPAPGDWPARSIGAHDSMLARHG